MWAPQANRSVLQSAFLKIKSICDESGGRSQLFPLGGSGYQASITHYLESSTEIAAFAVQPGSEDDLQSIIKVIAETSVPFAVKSGGYTTNRGFSSTKGVQICLSRFNKIAVRAEGEAKYVDVGAGCLFGEVYRALAPHHLNIVGGTGLAGAGVSGWLLSGGYSVKTSQYGLGIDNVESARVVLPDGSLKTASATENETLFFAIKGGGNNFGIVTEFTLKTHPQGEYYSFQLTYKEERYKAVKLAIANFSEQTDDKANIEAVFGCHSTSSGIQNSVTVHCVYDGPFPAVNPFEELLAIEHVIENYADPLPDSGTSTAPSQGNEPAAASKTNTFYAADTLRSFENGTYNLPELPKDLGSQEDEEQYTVMMFGRLLQITEFVGDGSLRQGPSKLKSTPHNSRTSGRHLPPRGRWGNVMVDKFTPEIIDAIERECNELAHYVSTNGCKHVGISLWPFTSTMFTHATSPSAWPHHPSRPSCPLTVYATWTGAEHDEFWTATLASSLGILRKCVSDLRPTARGLPCGVGMALAEGTQVAQLYGGHLQRLRALKKAYDPKGVMCRAGGFKIHHTYNEEGGCRCNRGADQA